MTTEQTWARRIYERHLDLLLAEEVCCNSDFGRWVIERSVLFGDVPDGAPAKTLVEVSHDDHISAADGSRGENDLFVSAQWPNGQQMRILIEDKLDAVVQPAQFARLLQRARAHSAQADVIAVGAAVVAPAAYLARHSEKLSGLATMSIEDIAYELDAEAKELERNGGDSGLVARLRWRSQRLVRLDEGRRSEAIDDAPTIAVRDYIVDGLAASSVKCVPHESSMHTANQGWLYFRDWKALIYKVAHGTVDVYLRDVWPDDEDRQGRVHAENSGPDGFEATEDTKHNLIFSRRLRTDGSSRWRIEEEVHLSEQRRLELDAGIQACSEAVAWLLRQ
jgi:hypothetical protein